jgi:uncharacterized protein YgbK (DUF1537 family)
MLAGVIADDLTGALEMGAMLASCSLRSVVTIGAAPPRTGVDAMVIDTETRNQPPECAASAVYDAASRLREAGILRVFKKIDSTLRGPIGAELKALHYAWGGTSVVLTPAYPRLRRTVADGRLLCNGVEISQTEFARDARWPVKESRVDALLPDGSDAWVRICDAATDEDLRAIVASYGTDLIYAGSGGLGRAWVESFDESRPARPAAIEHPQRILVISGSNHPVSRAQVAQASRSGYRVIAAPAEVGSATEIQKQLVSRAMEEIAIFEPDLLILFGGETAASLLTASGCTELFPMREVLTGIALSRAHLLGQDRLVFTKAGGFGSPYVVDEILGSIQV